MNFSIEPWKVRLERFKDTGGWYETIELDMEKEYYHHPTVGVEKAMIRQGITLAPGWMAVVLDPYCDSPYPILVIGNEMARKKSNVDLTTGNKSLHSAMCPKCQHTKLVYNGDYFCTNCDWVMNSENPSEYERVIYLSYLVDEYLRAWAKQDKESMKRVFFYIERI